MSVSELISTEPATGRPLWRCPVGDVDVEVALARATWVEWAGRPLAVRVETMRRFANIVRGRLDSFAGLVARETGKPLWEAREEVDALILSIDTMIAAHNERNAQRRIDAAMNVRSAVRPKPHGVLGVIGPFSSPIALPNGQIAPALIAGNAVIFKPSEKTPACGAFLVDCYHEAGVPDGAIRLLLGGPDIGQKLAGHDRVDGILFSGSPRTGISLHQQFSGRPDKLLTLEMGGNNPIILWDPTDIQAAAMHIVQSAFLTTGQRCTNARRLIVEEGKHESAIEAICAVMDRLILGGPHADPAPFMGPVIDNDTADALQDSYLSLLMKGARPIRRMDRPVTGRPFLTPALLDVTDMRERMDVEIFGPLLQIIRVPSFEAALIEANASRYNLCAALIGGSPALYDQFWANIRAGMIHWNRPTNTPNPNAPRGGVGLSGNHRPSGFYAADYCAYPVTSSETEQARGVIATGLRDS